MSKNKVEREGRMKPQTVIALIIMSLALFVAFLRLIIELIIAIR